MRLLIAILLFLPFKLYSQLTIGQVFDFEIGDEFHYKSNYEGPFWVERKKVMSKRLSAKGDTVFYTWQNNVSGIDPNTLEFFIESKEFNTWHVNLDSSIFTLDIDEFLYKKRASEVTFLTNSTYIDSSFETLYVIDSMLKYDTMVCDFQTNGLVVRAGNYPNHIDRKYNVYGKGLGLIFFEKKYYNGISEEYHFNDKMFYFKKADDSCGTPDYTSIKQRDEAIKLAVFPNPANSTIYLNSSKNIEYQILSSEGKLLMQGSCTGAITIATLPKGVYFLNLRSESEIQIIKFIKLNSQF